LGANSERLAQKQVLLPEMPGSDEIAQLDSVFHRMAETLVEAARKERAVVDNAADVICSIDPQNRFAACNPAACKIWGFSENELLERNVLDIVDPDSAEETGAGFSKARRENSTSVFENRILTKDAQPIDMLWSVYWSEAEQRMFCVAHDISEQKRAERLRKEVLDMVTHDLRSPLASIDLSIDMLQQGYKGTISDQASGELEKIKRNSSRMMRLVNDLLDMEKLKEGKLKLVSKDVNLQVIVENAFDVVLPAANQRRIKLLEENTDIEIFADGVRVGQILINLLSNALKFSPENSVVKVAAESRENEIVVKVIDNGPGMTAEQAGRLFQRFSQLEAHLQQGSGLGLAICKALVDLHGGSIGVESEKGKGSTFWFSLPLNAPVPSPDLAR
jgi:PAS domain S-box-containing protein